MNPDIRRDQLHEVANTNRKRTRNRRPLSPLETRDWMTPNEAALALGCSIATVHRIRRGLIPGIEPPPCIQYGRKFVFRKASLADWQERNENSRPAA
jgi:Helix-turn-helix domain